MSRRFVETEGRRWVELEIITPEQHRQIVELYTEKKRAVGLVPLLGSILFGLGILSFVAANWQGIPQLLRLLLIIAVMAGFYAVGDIQSRRGHGRLGVALTALGLVSFGAGIILTAQMFHLEAYDALSWTIWGTAGVLLTYLYNSRFLLAIGAVLFAVAQGYSAFSFHQFSYAALLISMVGLGYYAWSRRHAIPVWLFSLLFTAQSAMLVAVYDMKFLWVFIPVALLYTLGDTLGERNVFYPLQAVPLLAAFLFDWFVVVFTSPGDYGGFRKDVLPDALPFLALLAVPLLASFFLKLRAGKVATAADWMLFPALLYVPHGADAVYMIVLFVFSLYQLWRGYAEEWRFRINLATVLFLISTMTAYGKLTWAFMDKSWFFIIGGALLLLLSWLLNRRNKQVLRSPKEEGSSHAE